MRGGVDRHNTNTYKSGNAPGGEVRVPFQAQLAAVFERITMEDAVILAGVAMLKAQAAIAAETGIAPSTVKHRIDRLRDLTGCATMRELALWWRRHRDTWLAWVDERTRLDDEAVS